MSEWIRHRGSKAMPKRLEGKRFEVRYRNGKTRREPNVMGWHHDKHPLDVMAYRITGDINLPDHSKGFPVGTTAKGIGAKVGDEFVVVDSEHYHFEKGETVTLAEDDGTNCPFFLGEGSEKLISIRWFRLAPIQPKTAIELQAEEVWIPEPAQEWPEDRMDIVGQNGNDGLHYDGERQKAEFARDSLIASGTLDPTKVVRREDVNIGPKSERKPTNKYQRTIKGVTIDVYDVLAAFGVTCQARGHAIKKLLMAGQRGHKDEAQDLREAVQAIERSIELIGK